MLPSVMMQRIVHSLTVVPSTSACYQVAGITVGTTICSGAVAITTGFIDFTNDWDPPTKNPIRPLTALLFPSLFEEIIWRAALIPLGSSSTWPTAGIVLAIHVLSHPIAAMTVWPRGKEIFGDSRFLLLASIVLGGATTSYIMSGGSVWAAALTHGVPVALWRDFFGGEKKLSIGGNRDK